MEERFRWQHIEFINGGNPYISKTREDFEMMKSKYKLTQIKFCFWIAEEREVRK